MAKRIEQKVLECAVELYQDRFCGISSLDISRTLNISNKKVMEAMLTLEGDGQATLNKDVQLTQMRLSGNGMKLDKKPTVCHIIFPTSEVLTEYFYTSVWARRGLPVYTERLHKGAHQYGHAFFSEDVLAKYLDRPELYEVEDTLSGGHILSTTEDESTFIHVRHGRRLLANGRSAVLAIITDLHSLDEAQQRYWHGFEIANPELSNSDDNYVKFMQRTFEGAWIDFENPLDNLLQAIKFTNEKIGGEGLFRHTENAHLRTPLENTEKAFYDSCSELFKLIDADSLNKTTLLKILTDFLKAKPEEFIHAKSGRTLSPFQLLQLVESKAGMEPKLTTTIDEVKGYRVRADHALLEPSATENNYVSQFHALCDTVTYSLYYFATKIEVVCNP